MKKKVERGGQAQFLRNLWKFRRNLRKFQKSPEVSDIPDFFAKNKLKIIYFKMLIKPPCIISMMIKMKSMRSNLMMKKLKNQSKDNKMYLIQECTKAFNATIQSTTYY